MIGLHRIEIIGWLSRDPEMRFTPSGKPVTSFTIPMNHKWTSADGEIHQDTTWYDVTTWGKTAESCNQYLAKGSKVFVEGRPEHREWETDDGQHRCRLGIQASNVLFLDPANKRPSDNGWGGEGIAPDELPFE